jgi:hypothetical protein
MRIREEERRRKEEGKSGRENYREIKIVRANRSELKNLLISKEKERNVFSSICR